MGACCSKGEPSLQNAKSFTRVTDSMLSYRKPTTELSAAEVNSLVEEKTVQTHDWFLTCVKSVLDWSHVALDDDKFKEFLKGTESEACNYFRSLFLSGTSGENVPIPPIKKAEAALCLWFKADYSLFVYCNQVKSFTICTRLKRQIVTEHFGSNTEKLLRKYDEEAQGPYADRCRSDLCSLLSLGSDQEALVKLEAQVAMDIEILDKLKAKAQEKARTDLEAVFRPVSLPQSEGSPVTKSMMQSQASVVDFIDRLLSVDNMSSSQSYMLAGHLGSLKNGSIAVKPPDPEVPVLPAAEVEQAPGSGSSRRSARDEDLESRLLHIDPSALHGLD